MIAVAKLIESTSESDSMDLLASRLLQLSEQRATTPVLVTPTYLTLRKRFFVELVRSLSAITDRPVRIDWYRPVPTVTSLLTDSVARWSVSRTNRDIASVGGPAQSVGMMQITATVSRPASLARDLVVGWSDESMPLPPWTTAIELGA
ncbi:MAG: hypothetical protein AAGG48_24320 [Planctomycetota bacterium]